MPQEPLHQFLKDATSGLPGEPRRTPPGGDKWQARFLDYLGLGLILMPVEVLGQRWLERQPISSHAIYAAAISIVVGGIVLAVGLRWEAMSPGLRAGRLASSLDAVAHDARAWLVAGAVIVFGVPITIWAVSPSSQPPIGEICFGGPCPTYEGSPLGWAWEQYNMSVALPPTPDGVMRVLSVGVLGKNVGSEEVTLKDAYMVSGIDGTKLQLKIRDERNEMIDIAEIAPIPANAQFALNAQLGQNGLAEAEFLRTWGTFSIVIDYDGKKERHMYSRELIRSEIDAENPYIRPHPTRRKP